MSLSTAEKLDYIKNHYHQTFNLKLNENIVTNGPVNLSVPFSFLYASSDAYSILSKYPDTTIEKETYVYCTGIQDGDTIYVKNVKINEDNSISLGSSYPIRLSGVDTPEVENSYNETPTEEGGLKAKEFTKQCCLYKFLYLNIDKKREKDNDGRTRAIVIVNNKNLNEVLIRESLGNVMYIKPTDYDPNDWNHDVVQSSSFSVNSSSFGTLSPFLNSKLNNIVFTPKGDFDKIYQYEIYKDMFFIRMQPFSQNITGHIFPKNYDCSNRILLLKDDMTDRRTITKSNNYKVYENKDNINAYFQENGNDRIRDNIPEGERNYTMSDWGSAKSTNTFVEFSYDISDEAKSLDNLEIFVGYKYNSTTPFYNIHYTGVKDKTNLYLKDRTAYLDVNIDSVGLRTTGISKFTYDDKNTSTPSDDEIYIKHDVVNALEKQFDTINHLSDINRIYHKKIKYINDGIYIEENGKYSNKAWPFLKTILSATSTLIESGTHAGSYYLDISVKDEDENGYPNNLVTVDGVPYYTNESGTVRVITDKGNKIIIANGQKLEYKIDGEENES